jgi:hypothetical protein
MREAAPRQTVYGAGGVNIPVSVVDDESFLHGVVGQIHPPPQVPGELRVPGCGGMPAAALHECRVTITILNVGTCKVLACICRCANDLILSRYT